MSRLALLAAVALVPLSALGCRKDSNAAGDAASSAVGGGPQTETPALLPGATCSFPTRIHEDTSIAAGCVADVTRNVLVENGSVLSLEPGVTLRFADSSYLEIGHKGSRLVAKGTADKPIVFTSGSATKRPGDWVGLVFDEGIGAQGSTLEHAVIEYAGRDSHGGHGAITVFTAFPAGRVSVRDVVFRHNNLAAVSDAFDSATFAAFERNRFENDAAALRVSAPVLAAIGAGNDFGNDAIEVLGGTIAHPGAFPAITGSLLVTRPITVAGAEDAKLTLPRGLTLRFAKGTWLEVGVGAPGALDAVGVTFTSAEKAPKPGDWVGVLFGDQARGSRIAESVIELAGGEDHGGDGAITFVGKKPWQALDVGVFGDTFRNNLQAHVSDNGEGCVKAIDPKNGNGFAGSVEPCK